ncbi:hypothetical protein [Paraburkholderia sp. DHOC27]|uniref:hypothetical protein n=1 Tax=Paraburkholderia sp. DHOC27 TaxID=2303330 RepID=UPI000E3C396B|nr:hypothetical protein [Paraburkholderia sp. DHOC27]RFU44099.1 hypothetical protein D0B32_29765 [Paraburkholderia sp. DHOC27]
MPRAHTSLLLKLAYEAGDCRAALALLERSMALQHRRIALIRYLQAQYLHAPLEARHHEYVRDVAAHMSEETLRRVVGEARVRAGRGHVPVADRHDMAEVSLLER